MNQRAQYLIQILDKIGAPLMDAAVRAQAPGEDVQSEAQTVASLLGKVVESSISMNQIFDLSSSDAQNDALRLALAGLAGPMVAGQYVQHSKIPDENALKRIQAAMQAVLTFGDNFTVSPEHIERLQKLEGDGAPMDAHQITIQYVHTFIPVVNAVSAFSFGQAEQKLVIDISDRLVKQAVEMRESLLPELDGDDQKIAELGVLRALTQLYASCHMAETQRLSAMKDAEEPSSSSMDAVWSAFDTRAAMLETLARNILPKAGANSAPAAAPPVPAEPPPAPPAAPETPVETAAPPTDPAPVPPPEAPMAPPAQAEQSGGGPMSFFKKPGDDGNQSSAPPASPPEVPAPPAADPQDASPPPPSTPPADPPAPPPPAEEKKDESGESSESGDGGGSPMSFFKKSE